MNKVEKLIKEYRFRRADVNYIYANHGKNGVHYDLDDRVCTSDRARQAGVELEKVASGLVDILDDLDKSSKALKELYDASSAYFYGEGKAAASGTATHARYCAAMYVANAIVNKI